MKHMGKGYVTARIIDTTAMTLALKLKLRNALSIAARWAKVISISLMETMMA